MNNWDATAPFPLSRRDMLKTRSWRHGTLTKFILLSTFIFNLLTFRNLSQRLKVKNGDFKHFTCISAWEIRAWHVPSHPGWVGPPNFWGFFSHGIYVWAYSRQNLRNFGFLNHPNIQPCLSGGYHCPFCPFCLCLFSVFFVQDSVLGTKWTILGTKGTKGTKILDKWDKKLDKLKCRECIYSTRHQQFRFSCQCFAVLRINWNHWRDWNKQNSSTASHK